MEIMGLVAEIRYGKIKWNEEKLAEFQKELESNQENSLIKEEVD